MADSAIKQINSWAKKLPAWQSDAVRRLLDKEELSQEDKNELLLMLKADHGLIEKEKAPTPKPVVKSGISGSQEESPEIVLKSILNLKNVNAIPDDSSLEFGHEGLTVIFGENGTGKSGYARVLKKGCRARDQNENIKPNVYERLDSKPASATFKLSINGEDKEITWFNGKEVDELSNICVFDARSARIIIDSNNETSYLPYGAFVFAPLADLLSELKVQLNKEKPELIKAEIVDLDKDTKAYEFYENLSIDSKQEDIDKATEWTEDDDKSLKILNKTVLMADEKESAKEIQRLTNDANRITKLSADIQLIDSYLSKDKLEIKKKIEAFFAAKQALQAIIDSMDEEPLKGVGDEVWRTLYNAAKDFSTKVAYPEEKFPFVGKESSCPLCMQALDKEAKERLKRFNAFMHESVKQKEETAGSTLMTAVKELEKLTFDINVNYEDLISRLDKPLKEKINDYYSEAKKQAAIIKKSAKKVDANEFVTLPATNIHKKLIKYADKLKNQAQKIEKDLKPEQSEKNKRKLFELASRKALSKHKNDVTSYVKTLKEIERYNKCIAACSTSAISSKGKQIISSALTPQLKDALASELKDLGASNLPLNIKPSAVQGETCHKMTLEGVKDQKASLLNILSEGEQQVVALAGFFAELSVEEHECPIIFDDPVSSLDHKYREKIADRLAKEALKRQVIVFTHDIAFLLLLEKKIDRLRGGFSTRTIKKGEFPGLNSKGVPWSGKKTKGRLEELENELGDIKDLPGTNIEEYNRKAGYIYGRLRETWEASIENDLFDGAVARYTGAIQTKRVQKVTVADEDYFIIDEAMDKCSTWMIGHDRSKSLDVDRPPPDEIKTDIEKLRKFSRETRQRLETTQKTRQELMSSFTPTMG